MPSRGFHSKSRHGCAQCKARKVTCDLCQPVCRNCARRRQYCQFSSDENNTSRSTTESSTRSLQSVTENLSQMGPNPTSQQSVLLHHFSSKVSLTLSDRYLLQESWASGLSQDACDIPHLMHSILAISALHLSRLTRVSKYEANAYRSLAVYRHGFALFHYRPLVTTVRPENFNALYASAILIFMFNAARPKSAESSFILSELAEQYELARGVRSVRGEGSKRLQVEESEFLRAPRAWDFSSALPDGTVRAVLHLESMISSLRDSEDKCLYTQVVHQLRQTFTALVVNPDQPLLVFMWLTLLDRRYIQLVVSQDPVAVLIMAQYALCLLQVSNNWCITDWARHILHGLGRLTGDQLSVGLIPPVRLSHNKRD